MCGALQLSGIVRTNVRLNIAIPMFFVTLGKLAGQPEELDISSASRSHTLFVLVNGRLVLSWGQPDLKCKFFSLNSEVIQEPLPLRPGILVKKAVVLVKRKTDLLKPSLGQKKTWKNKEKSVLVNPFSRFTKTNDCFLPKFSVLRAGVLK